MADQARRVEDFADKARRLLVDVFDLDISRPGCPECSHFREFTGEHESMKPKVSSQKKSSCQQDGADHVVSEPSVGPTAQSCTDRPSFDRAQTWPNTSPASAQYRTNESIEATAATAFDLSTVADITRALTTFSPLPTPLPDIDLMSFENIQTDSDGNLIYAPNPFAHDGLTHNATSHQDVAALHLAAKEGQTDILSILLQTGFDVDSKDEGTGRTPLHQCVMNGHVEAAKVLLEAGAIVNAVDNEGDSVIFTAVKARHPNMVELLLSYRH
jgi:hypothetical protein